MGHTRDAVNGEPVRMVALTVLADEDYLALVRTSAMHVGALLFFPLPRVNDLRLAVDEACSMLVPLALPGAELVCRFSLGVEEIRVRCSVPSDGQRPPVDGFPWQVLVTLTDAVRCEVDSDGGTDVAWIDLVKRKVDLTA